MQIRDKKFRYLIILPSLLIVTASFLTQFIRPSTEVGGKQVEEQNPVSGKHVSSLEAGLTYFFDLETDRGLDKRSTIVEGSAISGNHYCQLNKDNEFSVTFSKKTDEIEIFKRVEEVIFSFNVKGEKSDEALLAVCSFELTSGESRYWVSRNVTAIAGEWTKKSYNFPLPEQIRRSRGIIKIYLWNKNKGNYKIDDLTIELMTPSHERTSDSPEKGKKILEKYVSWDFESQPPGVKDVSRISDEEFISGKHSYHFDSDILFGPTIRRKINEVTDSELRLITASVWIKPQVDKADVNLVIEIKRKDETTVLYNARSTSHPDGAFKKGEWKKLRCQFSIPTNTLMPTDIISAYIWNKSESEFYADDFEVVFGDRHLRDGEPPKVRFLEVEDSRLAFNPSKGILPTRELIRFHLEENHLLKPYDSGSVYAHYPQTAGRFIENREQTDQLAVCTPEGIKIYNYCTAKNIFRLSCMPFKSINFNPSTKLLSGNLDDNPDHELVIFNSADKKLHVKKIKSPGFNNCGAKIQEPIITDIPVRFNDYILSSSAKICIGDFNNDKTDEIIIADPSAKTAVCGRSYNGVLVFNKINGDFIQDEIIHESEYITTTFPSKSGDYLIVSLIKNGIFECKSYTANKELTAFIEKNLKVTALVKNIHSTILDRAIESGKSERIIMIDQEWKFNSTMIDMKTDSIFRLDFKGFSAGKNPKYYEYISLTPGRFINHQKLSIVVGSCNFEAHSGDRNKIKIDLSSTFLPQFDIYTIE